MQKLLILIILLFFTSIFNKNAYALGEDLATGSGQVKVEYELPYYGLLPDNPLYYLKAIRDNLLKIFISDPVKKAEFDVMQSDKRMGAAKALFEKGKIELSFTTLSKAGNYFDDAISNIYTAKKRGDSIDILLTKMDLSSRKHQELIIEMQKGQKGDTLLQLKFFQERAHDFQERVEIIKSN